MSKQRIRDLSHHEQHMLKHAHIRLLTSPKNIARCDREIAQHHYLHDATLVGEGRENSHSDVLKRDIFP